MSLTITFPAPHIQVKVEEDVYDAATIEAALTLIEFSRVAHMYATVQQEPVNADEDDRRECQAAGSLIRSQQGLPSGKAFPSLLRRGNSSEEWKLQLEKNSPVPLPAPKAETSLLPPKRSKRDMPTGSASPPKWHKKQEMELTEEEKTVKMRGRNGGSGRQAKKTQKAQEYLMAKKNGYC